MGFFEALTENLEIYHFGFILNENFMDCAVKFANQDYIGKHANLEFFNTKSITTSLNFSFLPIHAMTRQFVVTTGSLPSVDVRHRDLISDEIKRSGLIHLSSMVVLPDARPELTALKVAMNNYQNFGLCRKRGVIGEETFRSLRRKVEETALTANNNKAIPLPSGGWPTKRPLGGAANVPATTVERAVQFDQFDSWSFMIPTP